jgi:hypothetical protein
MDRRDGFDQTMIVIFGKTPCDAAFDAHYRFKK